MKPEIRTIACADIPSIERWVPGDDVVSYWLTLEIGLEGQRGADLYQVHITTPKGLREAKQLGMKLGTIHPIVITPYSWDAIKIALEERLRECEADTDVQVQDLLRNRFHWEYEGYTH